MTAVRMLGAEPLAAQLAALDAQLAAGELTEEERLSAASEHPRGGSGAQMGAATWCASSQERDLQPGCGQAAERSSRCIACGAG